MKRLSLILFIAFVAAPGVLAKEWRGIVPLHSTRADVARLFGRCDPDTACKVRVENEEAYFVFSDDTVVRGYNNCAENLPPNTVLLIEVTLINPPKLSSLRINKKNFRTFDPSTPRDIGYKGYIDEKEGLIIKTYKGKVLQLDYIAAGKDVALCPEYYENPESFIQLLIDFCCTHVTLDCPTQTPVDGDQVILTAAAAVEGRVKYKWQVTAGKIVAGRGTLRITVDTTGVGGRMITATFELEDSNRHVTSTSCSFPVRPRN